MTDEPNLPAPKDENPGVDPVVPTAATLLIIALLIIVISIGQCGLNLFNARVIWAQFQGWTTVTQLITEPGSVLALGVIDGVLRAVVALATIMLTALAGPATWSVIGPILASVGETTARIVGNVSRSARERARPDDHTTTVSH
jgi:hypothetical protein